MSDSQPASRAAASEQLGAEDARLFGEMVRARRKAQGLRQEDVASATGVGRRYIIDMENGKPTLRIGPALMIARFLGIVAGVPGVQQAAPLPPLAGEDDIPPLEE